ncbi:Pc21g01390 [Penicillium rubens Wisconsin 54-1255]|uniref:Pc21g01390 protein n=2 Tax=Penicillium chrysogenum species complex TaxID=254878 RepID=B6HID1_PENRW|nr:Pc21g01390 [Penicillium rubens Wisconsin 54-1255]
MSLLLRGLRVTSTNRLALPISRRTFAISSITMAPTISDAIKKDHREIESYYDNIIKTSDETEQTKWQNQFTWELARHSIGEELVVYPAFEKYVPNGVELANKDRQEHQSVKEQLKKFQNMTPSDSDFIPTIKALMQDLSQHIKEEETNDLPALEGVLSQEESEKYSTSFGRTKMFVPSRSHPSAPDKPPYETAVGLLAAPIDHLADLFRKWPHTSGMPNPSSK